MNYILVAHDDSKVRGSIASALNRMVDEIILTSSMLQVFRLLADDFHSYLF
jgi:hypothetical protein